MARHDDGDRTPERYEETTSPNNPPNAMVNEGARRTFFWSYVGPIVVLFLIVGAALVYWASRGPVPAATADRADGQVVGTGGRDNDTKAPGGFNPAGRPDSTRDELKYRGVDEPGVKIDGTNAALTLKGIDEVAGANSKAGRQVELRDVEVASVNGDTFWAQQGQAKVAVIAPAEAAKLRAGMHVNVSGTTEADNAGATRVRATSVEIRK